MDTAGLNEAPGGAMSGSDAVKSLVRLLLCTKEYLNLVVMVMEKGCIHDTVPNTYKLFVEEMTSNLVPLVLCGLYETKANNDRHTYVQRELVDALD